MEIKVGDYYRTKKGLIRVVKTINNAETRKEKHLGYTKRNILLINGRHTLEEITKYSPNISDLIEVGDYVNEYRVNSIEKEYYNLKLDKVMPLEETELIVGNEEGLLTIVAKDIKTILTHELYEANCYKV